MSTTPDLHIKRINAPAIVKQGGWYGLSFDVENTGVPTTALAVVSYAIDQLPEPGNSAGNNSVNLLATGSIQTLANSFRAPANLSLGDHTLWVRVDSYDQIAESDESNNWASVTFTVTAADPPPSQKPDVVVSSISAPTWMVQNGSFNLSWVVTNVGDVPSPNHRSAFRIDEEPDATHYWGYEEVVALPINGSTTLYEWQHPATLSLGQHTLWVAVDVNGVIDEADETNNWASFTFEVVASTPRDLVVKDVVADATVARGEDLHFSYLIENLGTISMDASFVAYRFDQVPDESNHLGLTYIDPIAGRASISQTASISTAGLSVGEHTLWIKADVLIGLPNEGNETNNWTSITFTVTGPPQADLKVNGITAPVSVMQGLDFNFSYEIKNIGAAASAANWAGFMVDHAVDKSHYAGFGWINTLAVDGTQTLSGRIDTSGLEVGTHTLYVAADYWDNMAGESNEANNALSVTFEVRAPVLPDLAVTGITAGASVVKGQRFDFSYVVKNIADGLNAGTNWAGVMVDQAVDETHYLAFNSVGALEAGGTQTFSNSIDTSGLSAGTHTLYIAADYWDDMVGEGDEGNNVRSVTFEVTQADLKVDAVIAPASVMKGLDFTFSYEIKNIGTAVSAANWAGVMVDQTVDKSHYLDFGWVNALAVDGTQTLTGHIDTSGLGVGTHTLYIAADYWDNMAGESNEANNVLSVTFEVTAPVLPDLAVTGITAGASVVQGQRFDFSYVVKNIGVGLNAGTNWAGIMVDHAVDETHYVAFDSVGALAAGGTQTFSNSIDTSGLGVGTHTLYIAADYWGNMVGEGNEANNWHSITFEVTAPEPPDLAVTGITAGASVVQGQRFDFSYVVKNLGEDLSSGKNWAGVMVDHAVDETHYLAFNSVGVLEAGGTQTFSNSIDTSGLSAGTHTLYIAADYWDDMVGEGDEGNNVRSVTFEVTQADLKVNGITAPASVMKGSELSFSYEIKNVGTAASAANWAGVMVDHAVDKSHYLDYGWVNALAVDGTQTLTGHIDTSGLGVGTHTLYIAADYWDNMVGESSEANNVLSVTFTVTDPDLIS